MKYMSAAALALTLGLLSAPASAAPLGNMDGIRTGDIPAAEQVAYRRCWFHHGYRHCRYYRSYGYAPGFSFYLGGGHRHWHHRHW